MSKKKKKDKKKKDIGVGDIIAGVTGKMGLKPCKKCEERRKALNRLKFRR